MVTKEKKRAKNKKLYTIHGTDVKLNEINLKAILQSKEIDGKGMDYKELHRRAEKKFKLDLSYKGFMSLMKNSSAWKLLYAWAIADVLEVDMKEIFDIVDVDVEAKKEEKAEWKEKYQK